MTYCEARPWFVLTPNRMSRALIVPGPTCPWNLDSIASAGLPGISRGSRKLRVSAAHSVNTKKPRRRSANLKLVSSRSLLAPHSRLVTVMMTRTGPQQEGCAPGDRGNPRARTGSLQVQQHLLHV